ncbi:MAG: acyltransferase family protein, partial [Lachnospiraceae bacterium]
LPAKSGKMEINMTKKFFEYDLIRFIAMSCVVLFHFNCELINRNLLSRLIFFNVGKNLTLGQQGVVLFILMSGTLSCASFERCCEIIGDKGKNISIKTVFLYYKKRFLSIFPMYWVSYFFAYLLINVPDGRRIGARVLLSILGMDGYLSLFGINTGYLSVGEWYMGMIILLYLVCPLFYLAIKRYPKLICGILIIYYIGMVRYYPFVRAKETDALIRIVDFAIGMYFCLYIKQIKMWMMAGAGAIFLILFFVPMPCDIVYSITLQGICSYILLLGIGQRIQSIRQKVNVVFMRLISVGARYSYAVFLIHHLILIWALQPFSNKNLGYITYLTMLCYMLVLIVGSAVMVERTASIFKRPFALKL